MPPTGQLPMADYRFLLVPTPRSLQSKFGLVFHYILIHTNLITFHGFHRTSRFDSSSLISDEIVLSNDSNLELTLETLLGASGSRAHQTVALISSPKLATEVSFPLTVRPNGRAKVVIPYKKLPEAFLDTQLAGPLSLKLVVADFSSENTETKHVKDEEDGDEDEEEEETVKRTVSTPSTPLLKTVADNIKLSSTVKYQPSSSPLSSLPEIHHIFRPKEHTIKPFIAFSFISVVAFLSFSLVNAWAIFAGANLSQASTAFANAPIAYSSLLVSIAAIEFTFYQYYLKASIFETLFKLAGLVPIAVYSGSRALREVKGRRLQGKF